MISNLSHNMQIMLHLLLVNGHRYYLRGVTLCLFFVWYFLVSEA